MRIIHTFYTKCFEGRDACCGWLSEEANFMCWALSCLKAKEFYGKIELYTDRRGKEILVDRMELPYDKVHVVLDNAAELTCIPTYLWAISKVYTYSLQDEPFVHIDGDFVFWKKFDLDYPIVFQNLEYNVSLYKRVHKNSSKNIGSTIFEDCVKDNYDDGAFNMGLFGGCNIPFIKEYAQNVLAYVLDKYNLSSIPDDANDINCFLEQYYATYLVKKRQLEYSVIHRPVRDKSKKIHELADFNSTNKAAGFTHFLGQSKSNHYVVDFVKHELFCNYRDYYERIHLLFAKGAMKKYYFSRDNQNLNVHDIYDDLMVRLNRDHYTINDELDSDFLKYLHDKDEIFRNMPILNDKNSIESCYKSAISFKPNTRIRLNENFLLIKKYLCPWSIMYKSKKFVDKGRITTADDFSAVEKYCIYARTPFDSSLVTVWVNDIIAYFLLRVISREYITIREAWERMNRLVQGDKTLSPKIILLLLTTINEYKILDILND